MINKEFNLDKFKKQSAKVSGFLDEKGHSIPKSTILHALSIFLEEKNWNTLSKKLNNNNIIQNEKKEYVVKENNMEDSYLLILKYIYQEIFSKNFPVLNENLLDENFKKIIDEIIISNKKKIFTQRDYFPDAESLISDMSLIGDEQILKIAFSYNKKVGYNYYPVNLFDFLSQAMHLIITPDTITGSELGNSILGNTEVVYLSSRYRSKAYFFIPISMKEFFVERFNSYSASASSSGTLINKKDDINNSYTNLKYLKNHLISLGIEDVEVSCCFLNDPCINDFLKTR